MDLLFGILLLEVGICFIDHAWGITGMEAIGSSRICS